MIYTPPELTALDVVTIRDAVQKQMRHRNTLDLMAVIIALSLENRRLLLECNDHRSARGFDPLILSYDRK